MTCTCCLLSIISSFNYNNRIRLNELKSINILTMVERSFHKMNVTVCIIILLYYSHLTGFGSYHRYHLCHSTRKSEKINTHTNNFIQDCCNIRRARKIVTNILPFHGNKGLSYSYVVCCSISDHVLLLRNMFQSSAAFKFEISSTPLCSASTIDCIL